MARKKSCVQSNRRAGRASRKPAVHCGVRAGSLQVCGWPGMPDRPTPHDVARPELCKLYQTTRTSYSCSLSPSAGMRGTCGRIQEQVLLARKATPLEWVWDSLKARPRRLAPKRSRKNKRKNKNNDSLGDVRPTEPTICVHLACPSCVSTH